MSENNRDMSNGEEKEEICELLKNIKPEMELKSRKKEKKGGKKKGKNGEEDWRREGG